MTTKPLLKWVGGKTQLLEPITKIICNNFKEIHNYYEIFLGGGSSLLNFLNLVKNEKIILTGQVYAYDINPALIAFYQNIQNSPEKVYSHLTEIIENFNRANEKREEYYYEIRKFYNELILEHKQTALGSAVFLFLNKTCFRGLFREGPRGFNVPYGNYKNPEIGNLEHFREVSELIKDVIFECKDFSKSLIEVSDNSLNFVYLDPPYAPETATSFTKYSKEGFTLEQHQKLFEMCHSLPRFLLSNSDVSLVINSFDKKTYKIEKVKARRSINSKNPESTTSELLIYNF